jgi:hypothetical protein
MVGLRTFRRLLKQNPKKNIFLMEGFDLRAALSGQVQLRELLKRNLSEPNIGVEPYLSAAQLIFEPKK